VDPNKRFDVLAMFRKLKKFRVAIGCCMAALVAFCVFYVWANPLVFNESLFMHAHCIVITGLSLDSYAAEHDGRYPKDTNGYGNALLQLTNYTANFWEGFTGPGYNGKVFAEAARTGRRIPEAECGRIYVQGLGSTDNPDIALFFDKMPSPGGDHCHFPWRLYAPLGREVWTIGGNHRFIRETDWTAYSKEQIKLLVAAGISRKQAEEYYAESRERPVAR
jgi:hypothetical protein